MAHALQADLGAADVTTFAVAPGGPLHGRLRVPGDKSISHRVLLLAALADLPGMAAQAREIAAWGKNVNVKIPVTNTKGESSVPVVAELSASGVQVNVTAVFTLDQVRAVTGALSPDTPAIVSVFAGRIADTGIDPLGHMKAAVDIMRDRPRAELLWASPRELLNVFHADSVGCHIITVGHDVLGKLALIGKDLTEYSLETVQMFFNDATSAGYSIDTGDAASDLSQAAS